MDTKEMTEQAQRTAQEAGQNVKETAQEWADKAKGTARDAGAAADLYLHEYAWTSVAFIALLAGVAGYLLGSRRH
jgi:ElaB/YqjD/DUF883 family membrane-anchored ribosome-binding protein